MQSMQYHPNPQKPSDFSVLPVGSYFGKFHAELMFLNIMKILNRTGNKFRRLSLKEYKLERNKDENSYNNDEETWFKWVVPYTTSAAKALTVFKDHRVPLEK
jgi:hypothetical protein